jgi:hypothetical protein
MKKILIRVVLAVVVLLVVALVVGAMFLGSIIKKGVETMGPSVTKTDVRLDGASLSLLSGSGTLKGFVLGNPEGYRGDFAIKVGVVDVGVQPGSVFSDKVHVTYVRINGPEIALEGNPTGNNNLTKIMDNVQAATGGSGGGKPPPKTGDKGAAKKLQVDDLVITGGRIHLSTVITGGGFHLSSVLTAGKPVTVPLPDIHFTNLGEGPDGITAGELTKKVLGTVTQSTLTAAAKRITDLGKGAVDAASGAVKDAGDVGKAVKGVGDLFKKK